ncbi:MAG: cyclic pyranopterin monophosphate synthase, partial [Alphaproteobacteria bacterium]
MAKLTHIGDDGEARMVDVSDKDITDRTATARGTVLMAPETLKLIIDGTVKKGDVISVARLAGIMAAKRTSDLIPLCHPLALNKVDVDLTCDPDRNAVDI